MGMKKNIISISQHQGDIKWEEVKNGGVSCVFSRLGEGGTFVDNKFINNFKNSKKIGLNVGAWHIFRAKSSTPEEQSKNIIHNLKEAGFTNGDNFVFLVNNKVGSNSSASKEEMADNLLRLIECIIDNSELNISISQVYIKTNIDTWKNSVAWNRHTKFFKNCQLWVEQYRNEPQHPDILEPWGDNGWKFWEYSSQGKIDGITGNVLISKVNPKYCYC